VQKIVGSRALGPSHLPETQRAQQRKKLEETLAANVIETLRSLPTHSHHRKALLHTLLDGLPATQRDQLAEDIGLSPHTLACAARSTFDASSSDLITLKYKPQTKRKRIKDADVDVFERFLCDELPTQSGTDYRLQYIPNKELYPRYRAFCVAENRTPWSLKVFFVATIRSYCCSSVRRCFAVKRASTRSNCCTSRGSTSRAT
jgi:hypothetical protein